MDKRVEKFFRKKKISPDRIKYNLREEDKTAIYLLDGTAVRTYHPFRDICASLPAGQFLNINKGVALAGSQIVRIDKRQYTMADGRSFCGRQRADREHRENRQRLVAANAAAKSGLPSSVGGWAALDKLPLPFCVIRPQQGEDGRGGDFFFCYANAAMCALEHTPAELLVGHSIFEVFTCGDRRWLAAFADAALHGARRVIEDFSPEPGQRFVATCYQLAKGYCACLLAPARK